MVKGITHAHLGPIWYHSEPSDVPYSPNQFLGWDFFVASYSKTALGAFSYFYVLPDKTLFVGIFFKINKSV